MKNEESHLVFNEFQEILDNETVIIYLNVPAGNVVLFQAYFELYEGVGLVRTLDAYKSLICVITTPTSLADCQTALRSIYSKIGWRPASLPSADVRERFIGYFSGR